MTYCLAMRLEEGLIFLGDTRTNAGVDNVSTYRKVHLFQPAPTGSSCSRPPATWPPPRRCSTGSTTT